MLVSVEQSDIDEGICGDPWRCPVAVALKRVSGEKAMVGVGWAEVGVFGFAIPDDVRVQISRFDETGYMEPFTFETGRMYDQANVG